MSDERFPVLLPYGVRLELREAGCPEDVPWSVPWSFVAPHEEQARRNHDQSLRRLAERGGLSPCELLAVVEDRRWRAMPEVDAARALIGLLATHEGEL
jgi:hypothetical protein